ncbi:unnamed protein product, partial [Urochloa humidicola]
TLIVNRSTETDALIELTVKHPPLLQQHQLPTISYPSSSTSTVQIRLCEASLLGPQLCCRVSGTPTVFVNRRDVTLCRSKLYYDQTYRCC